MITCTLIDNKTGEIYDDNFNVQTLEDVKRKKRYIERKKIEEDFKKMQNDYLGNFVFFIYKNIDNLSETLTDIELVRYVYVGTYVKNDGILREDNNKKTIDKLKMKKLLQIGNTTNFNKYYNKLLENDLIKETEKGIRMNLDYFYRGSEEVYKEIHNKDFDDEFTRIYINTTRKLYENTENRKKKQLSIIYRLLPFINWKYNILCYNPKETEKENVKLFTIGDVMEILKYNKNQLARFKKDFYTIPCENGYVFKSVESAEGYLGSIVIVNPKAYYKGNNIKELEYLLTLFGIGTKDRDYN